MIYKSKGITAIMIALTLIFAACQPPGDTMSTDSTEFIQNSLDDDSYFYVDRNYIVDGTIIPPTNSRLVFGPNGQFTRTSNAPLVRTLPVISLTQSNVTLERPKIVGPNPCYWTYFDTVFQYSQYDPKREANHGISVTAGSNYSIINPTLTSLWGDAIYIDRGPENITINNLKANCVGRSIVSNTGSTNVTINGGESYGAFWWTFNIEPFHTRVVRDYKVNNFKVGWSRYHAVFAGGPDFNCQVFDVVFTNLVLTDPKLGANGDFSVMACADVIFK